MIVAKLQDTRIQKSIALLYTSNKYLEFDIKKYNTIYINSKIMKYLGISLTKHVQDLYEEN